MTEAFFMRGNMSRDLLTAIIVDGGFYRRHARTLFGEKTPAERADELITYCRRHVKNEHADLYRIFYYDCPPSEKVLFHPLTRQQGPDILSDRLHVDQLRQTSGQDAGSGEGAGCAQLNPDLNKNIETIESGERQ